MILVISCSLNPESRSRLLAQAAREMFADRKEEVDFVDLQDVPLPFCDGNLAYGDANAVRLVERGEAADAVLVATPVYNYSVSATTKNLVELAGRAWTGKPVGMLLAAGGVGSYMSGMGLANSLMLDFHCLVIPRFVYADPRAFADRQIDDPEVIGRIDELVTELLRVTRALRPRETDA